jgi:hypothetical protein
MALVATPPTQLLCWMLGSPSFFTRTANFLGKTGQTISGQLRKSRRSDNLSDRRQFLRQVVRYCDNIATAIASMTLFSTMVTTDIGKLKTVPRQAH